MAALMSRRDVRVCTSVAGHLSVSDGTGRDLPLWFLARSPGSRGDTRTPLAGPASRLCIRTTQQARVKAEAPLRQQDAPLRFEANQMYEAQTAAGGIVMFPRFCSNCLNVSDCEACSVIHRNFSQSVLFLSFECRNKHTCAL